MTVYLVGAGPGDPELITVHGHQLLARADVVMYDRLSVAALLDVAPSSAERISVGKTPGQPSTTQDEINALLIERGRTDACVVRLKGGDPFVFAHGGEEARALADAGIDFEVVPGITSAIAVPAYAGIPVTMRHSSTSFTVVTGHTDPAHNGAVNWEAVAQVGGTIVILMGVANITEIAAKLMSAGRPGDTPVAAVRWGTRPEQTTIRSTLAAIADQPLASPSTIVVGPVADMDVAWFENRPLFGRRVVVTRAEGQASRLIEGLRGQGAEPVVVPAIEIRPTPDRAALDAAVARAHRCDWVLFTSTNAVDHFLASPACRDARALGAAQVAVVGSSTAARLADYGVVADLVPDRFVSERLVEQFPPVPGAGGIVMIVGAADGRPVAPDGLAAQGWTVEQVAAYETVPAEIDDAARRGVVTADAITFTSGSTVDGFFAALGKQAVPPVVVTIGPVVAAACDRHGIAVTSIAEPHTVDGLIAATVAALAGSSPTIRSSTPSRRPRRLRRTTAVRRLVRETRLSTDDLIAPLFVAEALDGPQPIASLPGVVQHSVASATDEATRLVQLGIPGVMLFGIPAHKDAEGSQAWSRDGISQKAIRTIKDRVGDDLVVMADLCLDEYTDHGHCGIVRPDGTVDNDATLERYCRVAVAQADAGVDWCAPSGMMDGQVGAIRGALDDAGFSEVAIMAYAAKYASALYGPFRDAVNVSIAGGGDRRAYQQDGANVRESVLEVGLDIEEGADVVMVKPAMAYLDVIATVRQTFDVPVAAYHVSGEYSMIKAAAANGWIDGDAVALEHLTAIKRAGADMIITYLAAEVAATLS